MEDKLRELGFVDDPVIGLQKVINNYEVWVHLASEKFSISDKNIKGSNIIHEHRGATFEEIVLATLKHCSYDLLNGTECDIKVGDVVTYPITKEEQYIIEKFFITDHSIGVRYTSGGWDALNSVELVTPRAKPIKLTKTKRINSLEKIVKNLTDRIIALESSDTQTDPDELKQGDWAEVLEQVGGMEVGSVVLVTSNIGNDGKFLCVAQNKKGTIRGENWYFKPHQLKRINK